MGSAVKNFDFVVVGSTLLPVPHTNPPPLTHTSPRRPRRRHPRRAPRQHRRRAQRAAARGRRQQHRALKPVPGQPLHDAGHRGHELGLQDHAAAAPRRPRDRLLARQGTGRLLGHQLRLLHGGPVRRLRGVGPRRRRRGVWVGGGAAPVRCAGGVRCRRARGFQAVRRAAQGGARGEGPAAGRVCEGLGVECGGEHGGGRRGDRDEDEFGYQLGRSAGDWAGAVDVEERHQEYGEDGVSGGPAGEFDHLDGCVGGEGGV